ncbi:hypothetical protein [Streptomyces sp. NPDC002082]|uniref:hypothetical protein n=1 Tax=Streptomyces sp. NPDC002082 TaxID=3154772 RepID=UPI0033341257
MAAHAGPLFAAEPAQEEAQALARALGVLLRRAARVPSLAVKYEPYLEIGTAVSLTDLPVLTRCDLTRATKEALTLRQVDGPALLWAEGGSLSKPELRLLPADMSAAQVRRSWNPLGPADVLANLHPLDRLRPDHHFFHRFAAESDATALAFGPLPEGGHGDWPELFGGLGVTAVAAPPETVARLLAGSAAGRPLPWLRTLLLGGATHDATPDRVLAEGFPYTEVWRLYGSPAAGTIGQRGPDCLADVYHPLPYQHVEIVEGRLLVTTLDHVRHPPLIRYETQDRGEYAHCVCGRPGPAVRVFSPAEPFFHFHGRTVSARELAELAVATGEVTAAQVAVSKDGRQDRVQLRVRLAPGVPDDHHTREWIRYRVLENHLVLASCVSAQPDTFEVVAVDALTGTSALVPGGF